MSCGGNDKIQVIEENTLCAAESMFGLEEPCYENLTKSGYKQFDYCSIYKMSGDKLNYQDLQLF